MSAEVSTSTAEQMSSAVSAEARMAAFLADERNKDRDRDKTRTAFFEQSTTVKVIEGIARATVAEVLRRNGSTSDEGTKGKGRTEQTLELYPLDPRADLLSPADSAYKLRLEASIAEKIKTKMMLVDPKERKMTLECLGVLYPELVKCIVLDDSLIDRVYEPHFEQVFEIALDWFMHPEDIDRTHIRVGFGGNEIVGNRVPAYLVGAFRTVEQVRELYGRYTNWSMINALHNQIDSKQVSQDATSSIGMRLLDYDAEHGGRLRSLIESRSKDVEADSYAQQAVVLEVDNVVGSHVLPFEITRHILLEEYKRLFGVEPDLDAMGDQYKFSTKYPRVVVFNGASAAVTVNTMNESAVYATRDMTQQFLKKYAQMFHPEVADALVMQNDTAWDAHSLHTRMLLQYAAYIGKQHLGLIAQVDDKLASFEDHHKLNGQTAIRGIPTHLAYAYIHPLIFMDGLAVDDWSEKIPSHNAVTSIESPAYVIYHQGRPERIFGVPRKLFAENASLTDYIDFLGKTASALQTHTPDLGSNIWVEAQRLQERANGNVAPAKQKPIDGFFIQAAAVLLKNSPFKGEFIDFLKSDEFKLSKNRRETLDAYCTQLSEQLPEESCEDVVALITVLIDHQADMTEFKKALVLARDTEDTATVSALERHPLADMVSSFVGAVECQVRVGEIPVYYPVERVDTVIYPEFALPSLANYEQELSRVEAVEKRQSGTLKVISKRLGALQENLREVAYPEGIVTDHGIHVLGEEEISLHNSLSELMMQWDDAETQQRLRLEDVQSDFDSCIYTFAHTVATRTGIDVAIAYKYAVETYCPSFLKIFQEKQSLALLTQKVSIQRALFDYRTILKDIDSDEVIAEGKYHSLLMEVFTKRQMRRISH